MRVISQGGEIDVPYDLFVFGITIDNCVTAIRDSVVRPYECTNGFMAKYSTKEKAIKATEMLRETYIGMPIVMQNIDVSEDMAKEFERLKKCGVMVRAVNQPSKVDFINNSVFQFPQDEDVEV